MTLLIFLIAVALLWEAASRSGLADPRLLPPLTEVAVAEDGPVLEAVGVSLRFGGVRALTDVSFQVRPGEVRAGLPASAPEEPEPFDAVLADANAKIESLATGDPKAILTTMQLNAEAAIKG